ncbi:hypothetical protein QJS66_02635 [Kocuria rhizophila]|nr:hypothetical protein QJS66_02635 [Kocuria rhizophila]
MWAILAVPGLAFGYFTYKRSCRRGLLRVPPPLGDGIHCPWGQGHRRPLHRGHRVRPGGGRGPGARRSTAA